MAAEALETREFKRLMYQRWRKACYRSITRKVELPDREKFYSSFKEQVNALIAKGEIDPNNIINDLKNYDVHSVNFRDYDEFRLLRRDKHHRIHNVPSLEKEELLKTNYGVCRVCHQRKHISKFRKVKSKSGGYERICKECFNAYQREWRKKKKETEK